MDNLWGQSTAWLHFYSAQQPPHSLLLLVLKLALHPWLPVWNRKSSTSEKDAIGAHHNKNQLLAFRVWWSYGWASSKTSLEFYWLADTRWLWHVSEVKGSQASFKHRNERQEKQGMMWTDCDVSKKKNSVNTVLVSVVLMASSSVELQPVERVTWSLTAWAQKHPHVCPNEKTPRKCCL